MDMCNCNNSNFDPYSSPDIRRGAAANFSELSDGSRRMYNFTTPPQPTFDSEEMIGSMQRILAQNVGEFVVISFLIGTEEIIRKQGILYYVGRSFLTLYDDQTHNFIVCDIFSVKFVYFYMPGERPKRNYNILPTSSSSSGRENTSGSRR